jgi:hypothetical protein
LRFLVDQCFPKRLVVGLRDRGHDVSWATEVCDSEEDESVLAMAASEDRIVITEDKGFGRLAVRDRHGTTGVVIAIAGEFPGGIDEAVDAVCSKIDALGGGLIGFVTRVEPSRVRQHALSRGEAT